MARYMLHLKNSSDLNRKMAKDILRKSRVITSGMNLTLRDCRVSKKYVEFDTTISESDLDELVEKLSSIGPLDHAKHVIEEIVEKEQAISEGISYFNNERFWECHEAFEGVWKQCFGREKELVQGIILVAVAYAHAQENELRIGVAMLTRALEKLGTSPSMYHSIDVERIRKKSIEMQQINDLVLFEI